MTKREKGLHSMHRSLLRREPYRKPYNMAETRLPEGSREVIERIVLDIYTDMVNAGCSLQQTLTAIYLSGSQHAVSATKEI